MRERQSIYHAIASDDSRADLPVFGSMTCWLSHSISREARS